MKFVDPNVRQQTHSRGGGAAGRYRTCDQRVSAGLTASAPFTFLRVRCSTTELSSTLCAYTAASAPIRRRRAISSQPFIYSPNVRCLCRAPQKAQHRAPSGMSEPHALQFVIFSNSNCGSVSSDRGLRDHQLQPTITATHRPKTRVPRRRDVFIGGTQALGGV